MSFEFRQSGKQIKHIRNGFFPDKRRCRSFQLSLFSPLICSRKCVSHGTGHCVHRLLHRTGNVAISHPRHPASANQQGNVRQPVEAAATHMCPGLLESWLSLHWCEGLLPVLVRKGSQSLAVPEGKVSGAMTKHKPGPCCF